MYSHRGTTKWYIAQRVEGFMILTGTYELTVDPKNRLSVPAQVRAGMDPERDGTRLYLVPGGRQGTLALYADRYFEHYAERYHSSLDATEEKDDFEQVFYAMATLVEIDKQGRIVLPQRILDYAGIGRKVTLSGRRDHLVIWNREDFAAFLEKNWGRYPDLLRRAQLKTELSKQNGNGGPR
ncbi:MAG: hypothetical protein JXB13_11495 [Phycisphaerae bacterium]|nr:hypothetical protein [Phycisphaerae bacterium]